MVAIHSPRIAATKMRVQNGKRKMYERMRVGLNWGNEGIAARVGSKTRCRRVYDGKKV